MFRCHWLILSSIPNGSDVGDVKKNCELKVKFLKVLFSRGEEEGGYYLKEKMVDPQV